MQLQLRERQSQLPAGKATTNEQGTADVVFTRSDLANLGVSYRLSSQYFTTDIGEDIIGNAYRAVIDGTPNENAMRSQTASDAEVSAKKCDPSRLTNLQKAMLATKRSLSDVRSITGDVSFHNALMLDTHEFVVAKEQGTDLTLTPISSGEVHVLALAFSPVKLRVVDEHDNPMKLGSPKESVVKAFGREVDAGDFTDSRLFEAKPGSRYTVRVQGRGCTLVMVYRRL